MALPKQDLPQIRSAPLAPKSVGANVAGAFGEAAFRGVGTLAAASEQIKEIQAQANVAEAQSLTAQYTSLGDSLLYGDPGAGVPDGFMALRGKAAAERSVPTVEQLRKLRDDVAARAPNDSARAAFLSRTADIDRSYRQQIETHTSAEFSRHLKDSSEAEIKATTKSAGKRAAFGGVVLDPRSGGLDASLVADEDRVRSSAELYAAHTGASELGVKEAGDKAVSDFHLQVLGQLAQAERPQEAERYLNVVRDRLDPEDLQRSRLTQVLRSENDKARAYAMISEYESMPVESRPSTFVLYALSAEKDPQRRAMAVELYGVQKNKERVATQAQEAPVVDRLINQINQGAGSATVLGSAEYSRLSDNGQARVSGALAEREDKRRSTARESEAERRRQDQVYIDQYGALPRAQRLALTKDELDDMFPSMGEEGRARLHRLAQAEKEEAAKPGLLNIDDARSMFDRFLRSSVGGVDENGHLTDAGIIAKSKFDALMAHTRLNDPANFTREFAIKTAHDLTRPVEVEGGWFRRDKLLPAGAAPRGPETRPAEAGVAPLFDSLAELYGVVQQAEPTTEAPPSVGAPPPAPPPPASQVRPDQEGSSAKRSAENYYNKYVDNNLVPENGVNPQIVPYTSESSGEERYLVIDFGRLGEGGERTITNEQVAKAINGGEWSGPGILRFNKKRNRAGDFGDIEGSIGFESLDDAKVWRDRIRARKIAPDTKVSPEEAQRILAGG